MTTGRGAAALGPRQRDDGWHDLSTSTFDVLVVGGGITGAGVALDAATRGLRVALVEARDLASGTSSRSSKLFHGGLRYLEMLDFRLVREALHERNRRCCVVDRVARSMSFVVVGSDRSGDFVERGGDAELINRPIDVAPHAGDADVGLVDEPAATNGVSAWSGGVDQLGGEALDPPKDRHVIDLDAAFGEEFFDIAVGDRTAGTNAPPTR